MINCDMTYKKVLLLNLIIFFIILLLMETTIFFYRKINDKINLGYIKTGDLFKKIDDDCERMKSHPILGHIHDHRENCKIPDAKTLVLVKRIHTTSINFVKKKVTVELLMQELVDMALRKNF